MVYDRTIEDVNSAKLIRAEKVQKGIELTIEDINILERGTLTYNTLNRIEDKKSELRNLLNDMGYWNTRIAYKNWNGNNVFKHEDFLNMLADITTLKDAFFIYSSTPTRISATYHFSNINNIEKILKDLEDMIEDVKINFRYCGDFETGG